MEFEGIQVFNSCSWSNDYKIRGKFVLLLKNLRRETALGKKLVFTQQRANGTILKEKQTNKGCSHFPLEKTIQTWEWGNQILAALKFSFLAALMNLEATKARGDKKALLPLEIWQQLQTDSEGRPESPVHGHQGKGRDILSVKQKFPLNM